MIYLIAGPQGCGKGHYITERIKDGINEKRKMYLIVPEQQAVIWEERTTRELPPSAPLYLETVNFRRLAETVSRSVGGLTYTFNRDSKKLLMMWNAIKNVRESLSVYGEGSLHDDRLTRLMLETVTELRKNRITPSMLEGAVSALEKENSDSRDTLKKRLSDLTLIYASYSEICNADCGSDPDDILAGLAENLKNHDFFGGCDVYIDSFYSLTPVEEEILYYIIKGADNVYITFAFDPSDKGKQFDHIRGFMQKAVRFADISSKEYKTVILEGCKRTSEESLLYLSKHLWDFSAPSKRFDGNAVQMITCTDRYEEARIIGAQIERLVHNGAKYSDIAVVARDAEKLRGIVDTQLDTLGIPCHFAERQDTVSSPAVKFIENILYSVCRNFRREDIVNTVKTGMLKITDREISSFEEYTKTWKIKGKKAYLDTEIWNMNPHGNTTVKNEWDKTVLVDANRVKAEIAAYLNVLYPIVGGSKKAAVKDICRAVYKIMCDADIYSALKKESELLKSENLHRESKASEKVYGIIVSTLDTMFDTVGEEPCDGITFAKLFTSVIALSDVGTIPRGIDSVTFGSAYGIRCGEVKHVIVPGCIEGEFPCAPSDNGFFTDSDKAVLESFDINFADNTQTRLGEELFRFYRTVTMPSETLTLIVPQIDGNKAVGESLGAKQIKRLLCLDTKNYSDGMGLIWSHNSVFSNAPFIKGTSDYDTVKKLCPDFGLFAVSGSLSAENDRISSEITEKIYKDRINLTQSRIDSFSSCKFAYYMNYTMKLSAPASTSISSVHVGTFIHKVLEDFFRETRDREYPVPDDEVKEIVERIIEEYIKETFNADVLTSRQIYLMGRLRENALLLIKVLMEEFSQSLFRPHSFELPMGDGEDSPAPLEYRTADGTRVSLFGVIDRVDTYTEDGKVYVRVVDYKTGTKLFNMNDIKKGINLQLLIYLFTLWKGGDCSFKSKLAPNGEEIIPAAMLYFSAPTDSGSSDRIIGGEDVYSEAKKTIYRTGLFLHDEKVLSAMDKNLNGEYLPVKANKKTGAVQPNPNYLKTLEEFGQLYTEVEGIITGIAEEMKGGGCSSVPSERGRSSPCRYCDFRPVCRHIEGREEEEASE